MADFGLKEFLEFLYDGLDGYVCVPVIKPGRTLAQAERRYFKVPEQLDTMRQCIEEADAKGCTVHHTPAVFNSDNTAAKKTFKASNVMWVEFDGNAPKDPEIQPTIRVQSSVPGKEHWYYKLTVPITDAAQLEAQNKKIADQYKADRCYNAGRLLRPLNTHHRKEPSKPLPVTLLLSDLSRKFSIKEVDTSRPKLPDSAVKVKPNELPKYSRELLEKAKGGVVGTDRSEDIWAAVQSMYEAGFVEEDAVAYLIELDNEYERWDESVRPQRAQEEAERQWDKHCAKEAENAGSTFAGLRTVMAKVQVDTIDFWDARPELKHIYNFSRARLTPPWAVLGCVLARVVASTEPNLVVPATVGSRKSLNLFVALVGKSSGGKGNAGNVAEDAFDWPLDITENQPGSGEGIVTLFKDLNKEGEHQHTTRVLLRVEEINSWDAVMTRSGSTLSGVLRSVYMGERLGFGYRAKEKKLSLDKHTYRACLTVGAQPEEAEWLLDAQSGGLPQRFIWMPADKTLNPKRIEDIPECPPPMKWTVPEYMPYSPAPIEESSVPQGKFLDLGLLGEEVKPKVPEPRKELVDFGQCEIVKRDIILDMMDDSHASIDGHGYLTQVKVASALALLNGRVEIDEEDWQLSKIVMGVSTSTRSGILTVVQGIKREKGEAQAYAKVAQNIIISSETEKAQRKKTASRIKDMLRKADEPLLRSKLNTGVGKAHRDYWEEVLESLIDIGEVVVIEGKNSQNKPTTSYQLVNK